MRRWFSRATPRPRRHAPFFVLTLLVIGLTTAYGLMIDAGWLS
jgi:hypothetical protein